MLFGHLVRGNSQLVIGNRQLVLGNRQLVIDNWKRVIVIGIGIVWYGLVQFGMV